MLGQEGQVVMTTKVRAQRRWVRVAFIYAALAIPALLTLAFVAAPSVLTLVHSFLALNPLGKATGFGGWQNYAALWHQPLFGVVLGNTLWYLAASVLCCVVVSWGLTLVLHHMPSRHPLARALLVAIFSPTIMPTIAAANIWLFFLAPNFGPVDHLMHVFGLRGANFLGHPGTALGILVVLFIWKYAPYFTLFLLAGFQAIPQNIREAMKTEDAGGWTSFRHVILPMMAPMIVFITVVAMLDAVQSVDAVYVMTQGGPDNGTNLLMFYLFQLGFDFQSWGPAAALSGLMMVGLSALSGLSLIVLERRTFHWQ